MKRVVYKKSGEINKDTKSFPAILLRSRERNKIIYIANAPVEVTDGEYETLKKKYEKDIVLVTSQTKLSKPMEVVIKGSELKTKKVRSKRKIKKKKGGKRGRK